MSIEAEKLFFEARTKADGGQAGIAAGLLYDLIARYPDFGKAHSLLGIIYLISFEDHAIAETYFKQAMTLIPAYSATYLNYAELLLSQERYAEQVAVLNKGLETAGIDKDKAYHLFGLMQERQQQFDDALENFQKAIMHSLDDDDILKYQKATERCLMKKRM